jgi:two-component system NarL family sensor kinase
LVLGPKHEIHLPKTTLLRCVQLPSRSRERTEEPRSGVARPVLQFAVSGLVALVLVGVAGTLVLRQRGTSESIEDALAFAHVVGEGVVEPNLRDGIVSSQPAALAEIDHALAKVLGDRVVRVKLWTREGRIIYSDERRLIGSRFPLGAEELVALETHESLAEVSDLSDPENRYERQHGELLEVYYPVYTPGGTRLLFETYLQLNSITASSRRIWMAFAPVLVAALIVLWLAQTPLAWSMARRIGHAQGERERLLGRAVEASDLERRRIAADLHDGVVQDLAAVAFGLSASADRLPADVEPGLRGTIRSAAASTRQSMRRLRSLLVEIYPPNLSSIGLGAALADLAAAAGSAELDVLVDVPDDLDLEPEVEALLFRAAQEALRNVKAHAGARQARVEVRQEEGRASLLVEDDGKGFSRDELERRREEGHVGLRLLADLAESAGGSLEVDSAPGRGTRLRLEVPAR